jgi:hypothetical protein
MFRIDYSQLNLKQIESILGSSPAPKCSSRPCQQLSGKSLKITLDGNPVAGPSLEYSFLSATRLTLIENGAADVECDYGTLSIKNITLFSHMIPKTKRGYNVIINWKTGVVTVFEMWFIDYEGKHFDRTKEYYDPMKAGFDIKPFSNREVQRQCYYGYFAREGHTPPEGRDHLSLRLENSMIKWDEDRGKKWLTTYTSNLFSTFVELDTPDGGDVLTFASDLLQINDSMFIHCYGEVEFSGRLSVEVIDLFSMKKIGVSMGIDENDAFEHTLYSGQGRFMGRYAAFFDINDPEDQHSLAARIDFSVKGARATYRPDQMTKKLTEEEVTAASKDARIFIPGGMTKLAIGDTDYCSGRSITFIGDDGFGIEIRFNSAVELQYRVTDESKWRTEEYHASELDEDLIILGFYRSGSNPPASYLLALDFKNGCATCIQMTLGSKYDIHDVTPTYHFGIFESEGVKPYRIFRHGFTTELLGRALAWHYGDDLNSIHIYNAPHSYSWTIIMNAEYGSPSNRAGGYVWSSPCEYIKLRDDVYIMSFVEQKWDGLIDIFCMNLRIMRDVGFEFEISHDGTHMEFKKVGAWGREAGKIDLRGVYPLENYNPMS